MSVVQGNASETKELAESEGLTSDGLDLTRVFFLLLGSVRQDAA